MKTKITIIAMMLISMSAISQTWSSVGTGMSSYGSANYLYVNPVNNHLIIGNNSDSLLVWNDTAISSYGPSFGHNSAQSFCDFSSNGVNHKLFAKFNSNSITKYWDYSSNSWTALGTGFSQNLSPRISMFNRMYLLTTLAGGGSPFVSSDGSNTSILNYNSNIYSSGTIATQIKSFGNTLYICGKFNYSTSTNIQVVYTTDGNNWNSIPNTNLPNGFYATCIAVYNGDIYIGGAGTSDNFKKWDGTNWNSISIATSNFSMKDLCVFNGKLYGIYPISTTSSQIFEYDGTSVNYIGTSTGSISDIETYNNSIYVVGSFTDINGIPNTKNIASWSNILPLTLSQTYSQNISCFNGNNGSAKYIVSGGVLPYSYSWSNGSTVDSAIGLTAGTYTVTVNDASNLIQTSTVTITQPTLLYASTSSTNESGTGLNDGTATVLPSGGTSPYSYSWSAGQSSPTATGLTGGTYTCTVTDTNGCSITKNVIVTTNIATGIHTNIYSLNLNIYPNPFTSQTTIAFAEEQKNTTIKIMDIVGKEMEAINFSGKQLIIEKGDLKKGIYLMQITDNSKNVVNKKIVVQ